MSPEFALAFSREKSTRLRTSSLFETIEGLLKNVREAVEACLSVDLKTVRLKKDDQVMEIAV